jgi:hypothetical protein
MFILSLSSYYNPVKIIQQLNLPIKNIGLVERKTNKGN